LLLFKKRKKKATTEFKASLNTSTTFEVEIKNIISWDI